MTFLENYEVLLKVFWFIAIPASIIFIVQSIMTFIGADATDGTSADFDSNFDATHAPFQLFSLRNLINFLLGFSWTGIACFNSIGSKFWLLVLSLAVGVAFIVIFFLLMAQISKLAENNTFRIEQSLNRTGSVYLTIPARKVGKGIVQVSVNGAFREIDAVTENDKIESGSLIRIVKVESENLVVVEKI